MNELQNISSKDIKIFGDLELGSIEAILIAGEPWFKASTICKVLEYQNPSRDVTRHTDEDDRSTISVDRGGSIVIINESGLYSLILRSNKPKAKAFKKWVTLEILPSIRKTGQYSKPLTGQNLIAAALIEANRIMEDQSKQIEVLTPKAEFFDRVTDSTDTIDIANVAQLLNIKGIGRNNLYLLLRGKGILKETPEGMRNTPYQKYIDRGYFKVIEIETNVGLKLKTLVYQKGLDYIRIKLDED